MNNRKTNKKITKEIGQNQERTDICTSKCKRNSCKVCTARPNNSKEPERTIHCPKRPKATKKPCKSFGRTKHQTDSHKKTCGPGKCHLKRQSSLKNFLRARRGKHIEFVYLLEKPLVLVKPQLPRSSLAEQKPAPNPLETKLIPQRSKYLDSYERLRAEAAKKRPPHRPSSRMGRVCQTVRECSEMHERFARIIQQNRKYLQVPLCGASCQVIEILESHLDNEIRTQDKERTLLEDDPRIAAELARMEKESHKHREFSREEAVGDVPHDTGRSQRDLLGDFTHETANVEDLEVHEADEVSHEKPKDEYGETGPVDERAARKTALENSLDLWNPSLTTSSTKLEEIYPLSKLYFMMKVRQSRSAAIETNFDEMLHEDDAVWNDRANHVGFSDVIRKDFHLGQRLR